MTQPTMSIPKRSLDVRTEFHKTLPISKPVQKEVMRLMAEAAGGLIAAASCQHVPFHAMVLGELASKSNQRKLVMFGRGPNARPAIIKSQKARDYVASFMVQTMRVHKPSWLMEGELVLTATIFYASQRPDLDCALLQDCIQEAGIVKNDRQFRELHIYHAIDKVRPRVEFKITPRQVSQK